MRLARMSALDQANFLHCSQSLSRRVAVVVGDEWRIDRARRATEAEKAALVDTGHGSGASRGGRSATAATQHRRLRRKAVQRRNSGSRGHSVLSSRPVRTSAIGILRPATHRSLSRGFVDP